MAFPKASWFDINSEKVPDLGGSYELDGNTITATTTSETGSVDYWGKVYDGYMILDSHSNINGNEREDIRYEFYPFDEVTGWYD